MADPFYDDNELTSLTHKRRNDARLRVLRAMGIAHRVRPDGSIAVLRSHVDAELGGVSDSGRSAIEPEPNWSAV
jgi:hypothetical protein